MKCKNTRKESSQKNFFTKAKKPEDKKDSTLQKKEQVDSRSASKKPESSDAPKKSQKNASLSFTSASCLDGIKKEPKHIRKMTFAERLKLEQESADGQQEERRNKFGLREISYSIEDKTIPLKFQKLRQKNNEHVKQRKMLIRSARKLKR